MDLGDGGHEISLRWLPSPFPLLKSAHKQLNCDSLFSLFRKYIMKTFKTKIALATLALCCSVLLSSCMTTKTSVGAYKESTGEVYTYAKSKQSWLFWGIVPLGRTDTSTPTDGDCEIVTRFNVVDAIISGLTGGLVVTYTIKVKAKK